MTRLDSGVWEPSALGLVGPQGAITEVRLGGGLTTYYAPFYDWMRSPAAIPDSLRARCELLLTKDEVLEGLSSALATPAGKVVALASKSLDLYACALHPSEGDPRVQAATVVADPNDGSNLVLVLYYWVSPAISVSANPEDLFGRLAMLGVFAEHLVDVGFVGLIAPVPDAKVRKAFAPLIEGVSSLKQMVDQLGAVR